MKKNFKMCAVFLSIMLLTSVLVGCGSSSSESKNGETDGKDSTTTAKMGDKEYDFYIFNTKGENADALQAAVDAYSSEAGQVVKVFSLGSGTDSAELLRAELSSSKMPTIFCCMNQVALTEFTEGGYAMNLAEASDTEFQQLVVDIPKNLLLTDDNGSYGIPFNIEGYGYIVDTRMIAALFGEENVENFIEAYKDATYDEFAAMVRAITDYINNDTLSTIILNNQSFKLVDKAGLTEKLVGVMSMAGSQTWTYGDHLVNIAIDGAFANAGLAKNATAEELDASKPLFEAYAQVIDLNASNATISRGPELINTITSGYDASVQNFAEGKALFLKQGNWAYTNIVGFNEAIGDTLIFLPVKMPFTDNMIQVEDMTAQYMNASIPVFVPNYYLINAKCEDSEKEAAEQFLVWLNTSEEGQKFVIEDMAFIPYNADPSKISSGYSLGDSIIEYVTEGKTLTNAYAGCPGRWSGDSLGTYIMENYLNKAEWPEDAYEDIADYAINSWKEMAGLN